MQRKAGLPTLLLTGSSGQIGFELVRSLACLGKLVVLDRSSCDLRDEGQIRKTVRQYRPDVIVNAAAYTDVNRAPLERTEAFVVNAAAPAILADEVRALGGLLVHYSTDYVFDGKLERPYVESDAATPLSEYGRSKLAGEQAIAASGASALILRASWVAGVHGRNFVKAILRQASEKPRLHVVADQQGAPTSAALVADVTAQVVARYWLHGNRETFKGGVYHLAAAGATTWHGYAVEILSIARRYGVNLAAGPDDVVAVSSQEYPLAACRPANSMMDTTRLRQAFGLYLPDWRVGIDHLLRQLLACGIPPAVANTGVA
ncbi:dTDP-4-dehydrorhamnose reductase subunit, NAD(P)-binding, of dTDP-L-rhamnose synthase [Cupriavidus taiwanensis]|uniref:dTDP-4-dehydrorhamnose reductase n=1 Tax=Cupriavidus taiwanensis TaxID=164546 RepID=UPI000E1B1B9F|nr:dTDP-4-dehydrorhamnose reductase [Cupriavidus taiwanensis]SOY82796.1 dTDP-4-dehydrorhamnose reductase subunit, NAD(P)-binding, of dTDP-L-rhamnose synthase [Cupriavidus taiwanensis]SOY84565.1 dTDP-4-dehydrorhamnose reductase subunit, NAD(P)-binding, of dTDP-L-rhamnose synthase [Cupriavidus taiwanensis]